MPDRSMVQVEDEMFVTFVTWMVHDFVMILIIVKVMVLFIIYFKHKK